MRAAMAPATRVPRTAFVSLACACGALRLGLGTAAAQPQRVGPSAAEEARAPRAMGRPSLFLSCPVACFEDFLRQDLSYFDFSRDPHRADFTFVVVRQKTGSGGERFTVTLSRRGAPPPGVAPTPTDSFAVPSGTPPDGARRALLQALLRLLQRELADTEHAAAFELVVPRREGDALSALHDPWDYWVLMPELKGAGEAVSEFYWASATGALTVRRITEPSKLRVRASYNHQFIGYELEDDSRISADLGKWDARALYAHALGKRWALGGVVTGRGSELENLRGHVHGGPLLELNVFPYAENASRQLRFAYQVGAWANWYYEANVEGLGRETRPYHALSAIVDLAQPWGSAQLIAQVNQLLDEADRYRVSGGVVLTLRLVEGLSLSLEGEAARVEDLLQLRRRQITDEELLLETAQQPTSFTLEGSLALTYAFGSTNNTIVNPRFARVDLDEE